LGVGTNGADLVSPPLVSLLIINWNYGTYIGATIDSIKSQDYPAIEVIVVDNGSTDDSRDVIAKHAGDDPRFRVVHLDENLGQLGAYFHAFELTSGEFVTIVDADDILFPSFVSPWIELLRGARDGRRFAARPCGLQRAGATREPRPYAILARAGMAAGNSPRLSLLAPVAAAVRTSCRPRSVLRQPGHSVHRLLSQSLPNLRRVAVACRASPAARP